MTDLFNEESQEDLRAKWHAARSRGIGGSEIGIILNESPYKTPFGLWLEKTKRVPQEDISGKFHVQRGIQGEIVARALYEQETGLKFEPRSWVMEGKDYIRCNDDGYNEQFGAMLEIKCMSKKAHEEASRGIIPEHYRQQLMYNLAVAKANIGYFISFRPEDNSMHVVNVTPDLEMQENLIKAAEYFWLNYVIADVPPELTDRDFVSVMDPDFEIASEKYKQLKAEIKEREEELEAIESHLHSFLGNAGAIRQNGLQIQRVVRKGSVDFAKIPQLKDVDLEPFRKPSSTHITIKGVKS